MAHDPPSSSAASPTAETTSSTSRPKPCPTLIGTRRDPWAVLRTALILVAALLLGGCATPSGQVVDLGPDSTASPSPPSPPGARTSEAPASSEPASPPASSSATTSSPGPSSSPPPSASPSDDPPPTEPDAPPPGERRGPLTWNVTIRNGAFEPASLTIQEHDTVRWIHDDGGVPHSATSDTFEFDSEWEHPGGMRAGDTYGFTFDLTGESPYHCAFHGGMTATIVVHERYDGTP